MTDRRAALCLHGLGVSPRHLRPLVRVLARDYDVRAPFLPLGLPVERVAASVSPRLVAGEPVVFANSMGCQVAVELAISDPGAVTGLVLVGPTADPAAPTLRRQLARLVVDSSRETVALNWVTATDYVRRGPLRTLRSARLMLEHPIEARLPLVDVPAVVVRGERDPIVPEPWAVRVAELLRAPLVVVPGGAHASHFTHPELVASAASCLGPISGRRPTR